MDYYKYKKYKRLYKSLGLRGGAHAHEESPFIVEVKSLDKSLVVSNPKLKEGLETLPDCVANKSCSSEELLNWLENCLNLIVDTITITDEDLNKMYISMNNDERTIVNSISSIIARQLSIITRQLGGRPRSRSESPPPGQRLNWDNRTPGVVGALVDPGPTDYGHRDAQIHEAVRDTHRTAVAVLTVTSLIMFGSVLSQPNPASDLFWSRLNETMESITQVLLPLRDLQGRLSVDAIDFRHDVATLLVNYFRQFQHTPRELF